MTLARLLRNLVRPDPASVTPDPAASVAAQASEPTASTDHRQRVLNVGGGSKRVPIPDHYNGWDHVLLDIDPVGKPDIVCDARTLTELDAAQFDAVYCSHNLEHYFRHDGRKVVQGFRHVLKPDGFAEIRVPDIRSVMKRCVEANLDVDDTLYVSPVGPILVHDVLYGLGTQIESSGVDFFAHKAGFTAASLGTFLLKAGFASVLVAERSEQFEIAALAFMQEPTDRQRTLLEI
jgi:SAM-dependent methyltransferase